MKASRAKGNKSSRPLIGQLREALDGEWPAEIYRSEVLSGKTRSFEFTNLVRPRAVQIAHTLLGIELKLGRQRIHVPDLATARYLAVFAQLGVPKVAVPYDITRISAIADRLESACQRLLLLADHLTRALAPSSGPALRRRVLRELRTELTGLGSGERYPHFEIKERLRR